MTDTRRPAGAATGYRLTYSTMFDPPESLHERFEAAVAEVRRELGAEHPMRIDGAEVGAKSLFDLRSPIDQRILVGRFPLGDAGHAAAAVEAARKAFRDWSRRPWRERVELLRRAASLIEERVWKLSAALSIEVGKNRMGSLGEGQETADLINWYCDRFEEADGFDRVLPNDPLAGYTSRNRTHLRPYGASAVIAPFNFPYALAGGHIGAALVTDHTVVFKTAPDTAPAGASLVQCLQDDG